LLHILEGHAEIVNAAQFSPDGNYIITASDDNTARIWETASGKLLHTLKKHADYVISAQFSPDGKYITTASYDNTARIWETASGKLLHTLKKHNESVTSAQFSPDGKYIITTSRDETARIWETASGKLLHTIEGNYTVNSTQFSPDGIFFLTTSYDTARIWETVSGKLLHTLKGHTSIVKSGQFSPDGKYVVTASYDKTARIWETSSGKLLHTLEGHTDKIRLVQFSLDGKNILTASADGIEILWDALTGKQLIQNFIFNGDQNKWLHLHSSGLFDASPEAMELMYWTKGLEVIDFTQLKDRYWLPGLWEKVMKGVKLPDVRNMSELKLQPIVEIQDITDDEVTVHLTKRDGGYGKVTLFINGKEAIKDIRPSDMNYSLNVQTIFVSIKDHAYLLDGENKITVKASSEDGFVHGRGAIGKAVIKKEVLKEPQFFAVVIGVGDYANDQLNLKYTVNDAEAISNAMQLGAENLFSKDRTHIYTITTNSDKLPNKENIKNIFKEISTIANAEDIITVYLSGHGITWGGDQGDFYFLTSDATATTNEAYNDSVIRNKNTISTSEWVEWLKDIPALKQVMIIDACGSGKAVDNLLSERDIEPSQIKAIDRMKDRTGMYIISGCTADAVSYEASMYGQGLLTYSILQAFKGAALKEDKYVDIFTVLDYARETVPDLAEGIGGIQEPQLLIPKGGSFDIGLLEDEDKIAIPLASPKTVYVRSTLVNAEEFEDNLGLSELLNQELIAVSSKGKNSPLVYFDAAKFPNACKVSGGYTIGYNEISISLKLRCGKELKSYNLKSETKEELIQEIVKIIDN
jgi:dipeptidyl aminopeptidase/acylaminoacyl peptidase